MNGPKKTYRLSSSLPLGCRARCYWWCLLNVAVIVVVLVVAAIVDVVLVAYFSLVAIAVTIEGHDISTAYEVDTGVDDDVEIYIRFHIRRGALLVLPLCLKYTTEEFLDHDHLLIGG